MADSQRPKDTSTVEQSVSRALRDNLPLVRHTANELSHAIEDLVSACASTRPGNTLPAMLRAQTASSSLEAMLGVLLKLVTTSIQPSRTSPAEEMVLRRLAPVEPAEEATSTSAAVEEPPAREAIPETPYASAVANVVLGAPPEAPREEPVREPEPVPYTRETPAEPPPQVIQTAANEAVVVLDAGAPAEALVETPEAEAPPEPAVATFQLERLSQGEQELHRRANRVAKVSMQDIRMLRPKDVELGLEHKDLCIRLRQDLDKARKEYVRRFGPILEHPVDYFHHWMVEILAKGDREALGDYPYPTPVARR